MGGKPVFSFVPHLFAGQIRESAVMAACRKQKIGAVKFLIKRGARLDLCDKSQFSALRWAATHGDVSLVRLLLRNNVSVHIDCCTPNSALEIAMSYPTKAHSKIVLLLQRQLVIERRQLLEAVRKKKEQEEIDAIKKYRRRMRKLARQTAAVAASSDDADSITDAKVDRSPFALPIVPSLKRKKVKTDTVDSQAIEDRSCSVKITGCNSKEPKNSDLKRSHSLRGLLETQLFSPPAMMWKKVGRGAWRQVEVRPQDASVSAARTQNEAAITCTPIETEQNQVTAMEIFASEGKWHEFVNEDTAKRQVRAPEDRETGWQLENLDC